MVSVARFRVRKQIHTLGSVLRVGKAVAVETFWKGFGVVKPISLALYLSQGDVASRFLLLSEDFSRAWPKARETEG